jgi:hypothetical protein
MKDNPPPKSYRPCLELFVKLVRIGLLVLAAMLVTAPLMAEEINAPEPHWNDTGVGETATASGRPAGGDSAAGDSDEIAPVIAPAPTRHEKAEVQIKEQEQQRVLGVLPSFNVSYRNDAVSLTGWQKMRLAFHSATDPVTFGTSFALAGYHEVVNDLSGFSWGPKGYVERAGAVYLDSFDGTMIGNGILPALLHQDPRYFRMGHGSAPRRLLYAASTAFICKHDNTGKWEPNYSNVAGNIAAGAISNLYYPGSNSGVGLTISNGMIQTATGAIGSVFQEFWPDISRRVLHKDPTHGLDEQNRTTANPAASEVKPDKP